GALDHQERAEPLACAQAGVAHGVEQPGWPGQFVVRQGLAEKLIEQAFSVLRDLIEPILELRCSVHIIPTSVCGRLSRRSAAISPVLNHPFQRALGALSYRFSRT